MSHRATWKTTTHDWRSDLDLGHLTDVRRRLGPPGAAGGLRHLILEVLAYANDEAESQGRPGHAIVIHQASGRVTVDDDGRGTDTRRDGDGRVLRKPVMATPDVRFIDQSHAPLLPDGLPRRGMSTVAALSSELVHENHREDGSWSQTYRYGIPDEGLAALEPRGWTGTSVSLRTEITGPPALTAEDLTSFPSLNVEVLLPDNRSSRIQ
ncbi:ATP-binding protein [Terrabacter aerolatus]|uniref:ATP-binding protein n=1 Tax=Terrabacter aerolatus TaxID=422442 RepID=UPI001C99B166|nr:ATP-binding protein [Terrabacter aerolatus]